MKEVVADEDDIKAKKAYQLYLQGKYAEAFVLYAEILNRNTSHHPSLLGYAEEMARRGNTKDALNISLQVITHFTSNDTENENRSILFKIFNSYIV